MPNYALDNADIVREAIYHQLSTQGEVLAPAGLLTCRIIACDKPETNEPSEAPAKQVHRTLALRREVAGDVEDQLRQPGGKGVDGAVRRRHDRHVRGDEAVVGVQRRDDGLRLAISP
jgi:hypothetical protein